MNDPRVPALRERLGVDGRATSTTYDKALADAVSKFQKAQQSSRHRPAQRRDPRRAQRPEARQAADIILANMERWRWMPHDLGKTHVIVNIPDFTLRVMHDGKQVWKTKHRGRQAERRRRS